MDLGFIALANHNNLLELILRYETSYSRMHDRAMKALFRFREEVNLRNDPEPAPQPRPAPPDAPASRQQSKKNPVESTPPIIHPTNQPENRAKWRPSRRVALRPRDNRTMPLITEEKFRIGLVQMSCSPNAKENMEKAQHGIREAAARGAQIICLQELFLSQYFCREENAELFNLAELIPGPSTSALGDLARELKVVLVASLFERRAAGLYHNTAAMIDADGALLGIYRKMHIPDDPLYYEKFYFTPGDLGFLNFDTQYGRIATLVCWDQWYPEGARLASLGGANVLFYPTAIGWHPAEKAQYGKAQLDAWQTIQRSHAIANGIYVAAVNRTGFEGPADHGLEFWGSSFVADPFGQVIGEASQENEEVLVVECDPKRMEEVRRNWPFFRDRRIDAYAGITSRWTGRA